MSDLGDDRTEVPPVSIGDRLKGRYRVERRLGQGGLGVVYTALDEALHDRRVVIKMPLAATATDPWVVEKFAQEVKALAVIDHPGIVGALDSGVTVDGRPFLVMQYVEGRSLKDIIPSEGLPLEYTAHLLRQIGHALAAAHANNICHRDLKPGNVMLQRTADGGEYVRLIDFGIASVRDSYGQTETNTAVAGTPQYMAPEQLEGRVSIASDIYAFAVIAYELVTGRRPFVANSAVSLVRLQEAGVSLRPSQLRPELPMSAEQLILKGLAFAPRDRPRSASAFGEELARALLQPTDVGLGATDVLHPHGDSSGPASRVARSMRGLTYMTAAVLIIGSAGAIWWALQPRPVAPSAPAATMTTPTPANVAPPPAASDVPPAPVTAKPVAAPPTLPAAPQPKAAAKKAEPERPAPAKPEVYAGPNDGRLVWSGDLGTGQELDLTATNSGSTSGALPGVPVSIELHPESLKIVTAPSAANGWRRLVIRNDGKRQVIVIVKWTVLPR